MNKEQRLLAKILKQCGLKFRLKSPDEEGGFFYIENGERKKFTDNIFVKRSINEERSDEQNEKRND